VGGAPSPGPIHQGTTPGNLDSSKGLVSALGGEVVHPATSQGAEITPVVNDAGTAVVLKEGDVHTSNTTWSSHPSAIGYTRPHASGGQSTGGAPVISPSQDGGTSTGSGQDELARVGSFNGGAAENPTAAQSGPTARAQQRTGAGRPASTDGRGGDNRD